MTDKYYNPFISDAVQRVNKAVESANKNLDNALEVAVDALKRIAEPKSWSPIYAEQLVARDALTQIATILKVKQKEQQ